MNLKHWLKIDHVSFLLIAPSILLDSMNLALFYDFYETVKGKE